MNRANYNPKTGKFRFSVVKPVPKGQVMKMYGDYQVGMSLSAIGKKYRNITGGSVRELFQKRGLALHAAPNAWTKHRADGSFESKPPMTPREVTALIARMTWVSVPEELHLDWRKWSMATRGEFILRVRRHLEKNHGHVFAPTTPHSSNVQPFDYTTAEARVIAEKWNIGKDSKRFSTKLKPASQGMIYKGVLYYWSSGTGYQCCLGKYAPAIGRPQLHRVIYKEHIGPIPEGMTVIQKDGNKNNFSPRNLALRSKKDCALMNSIQNQYKRNPTPQNLRRFRWVIDKCVLGRQEARLAKARAATTLLLEQFESPEKSTSLLATIQRRKK